MDKSSSGGSTKLSYKTWVPILVACLVVVAAIVLAVVYGTKKTPYIPVPTDDTSGDDISGGYDPGPNPDRYIDPTKKNPPSDVCWAGMYNCHRVNMGYAPLYATYRKGVGSFQPYHVDPSIYTHLAIAFAGVDASGRLTFPGTSPQGISATLGQYVALRDGCAGRFCKKGECADNACEYNCEDYALSQGVCKNDGRSCSAAACKLLWQNFETLAPEPNKYLKVLLSVGGWGLTVAADGTSAFKHVMLNTDGAQDNFIESCLKMCSTYGLNGIDMDIEYPGMPQGNAAKGDPAEIPGYTTMMTRLGLKLHQNGHILTCAVGLGPKVVTKAYEWEKLARAVDYIGLMSYDYFGAFSEKTGPQAGVRADYPKQATADHPATNGKQWGTGEDDRDVFTAGAVEYMHAHGVPYSMMVLGLGAYGRAFTMDTMPSDLTKPWGNSYNRMTEDQWRKDCMPSDFDGCKASAMMQTPRWDLQQFDRFNVLDPPLQTNLDCACGFFSNSFGFLTYYEIMDLVQEQNATVYYDDVSASAYTYLTNGVGATTNTVLVTFDSQKSILEKCKYSLEPVSGDTSERMAGVMIWTSADDDFLDYKYPISTLAFNYIQWGFQTTDHLPDVPDITTRKDYSLGDALVNHTPYRVTCGAPLIPKFSVGGLPWDSPGVLGSYTNIGRDNLGCTFDMPKIMSLPSADIPFTPNSICKTKCDVVTDPVTDGYCWLQPGDKFDLSTFTGNEVNPCKSKYPKVVEPAHCSYDSSLNHCEICNSDTECPGGQCLAGRDSRCVRLSGVCSINAEKPCEKCMTDAECGDANVQGTCVAAKDAGCSNNVTYVGKCSGEVCQACGNSPTGEYVGCVTPSNCRAVAQDSYDGIVGGTNNAQCVKGGVPLGATRVGTCDNEACQPCYITTDGVVGCYDSINNCKCTASADVCAAYNLPHVDANTMETQLGELCAA
jgi:GH18 family chitinase